LAVLLPVFGSNWSVWVMEAVLVWAAGLTTLASTGRGGVAPPARGPTLHRPGPLVYEPRGGAAATDPRGRGSRARTATLVAASGPALLRVTVKVMVSPTLGVALLTALARARSACCGVSVALAVLFVVSGSNWSAWLTTAVLVWAFGLTTRAVRVSVW